MSIRINQGPILPLSATNKQLFASDSQDSDAPPPQTQFRKPSNKHLNISPKLPQKQYQTIQPSINPAPVVNISQATINSSILPDIKPASKSTKPITKSTLPQKRQRYGNSFTNDSAQRYAVFNQRQSKIEIKQDKLPRANVSRQSQLQSGYGSRRQQHRKMRQQQRRGSSQGSRWLRSQSLGNQNKTFKYLMRSYHKHNSVMVQSLTHFWQVFQSAQKSLNCGQYKLSLYDSLQSDKLKMQSFLQRIINLQNYTPQRPSPQWSQQQYMDFYGNYRRVYSGEGSSQNIHRPYMLKKYKNCIFFGKMVEGVKVEGILHYFGGKCFEGRFRDDQKDYGLEIDQKELYLGQFKKGLRHGIGILKTSQSMLVGHFTMGQFSNLPKQTQQNQSGVSHLFNTPNNPTFNTRKGFQITHSCLRIYDGQKIVFKDNSGDIFVGGMNNQAQKQGEGLQLFANGDLYIGRYQSDSPQGYGEYYWQNGSYYRGQFLCGMRHGRGTWIMLNGDSYEGQYMNDKKNGKGVYIWKNGSKYNGNFQNDYRHGYGQMFWNDGRVYKGKWLNGIQKGTVITLQPAKNPLSKASKTDRSRPSFRSTSRNQPVKKRVPLDKLKSLYNPSYH